MKIVQINATCGRGSTGKICVDISKLLTEVQIENYILYSSGESDYPLGIQCANDRYIKLQALRSRIFGNYGFNSKRSTEKIIAELERIRPDIVHLHNIHGHDCDLEMLLCYLKDKHLRILWTFHDCWAFTAYCPHFTFSECDRWKSGCHSCPQRRSYSWFFDRSKQLYEKKKEIFKGLDLTIITPSMWLADLVKQSVLRDYPVEVIHNGIDLSVFRPEESNFRKEYNITQDQHIVLGVAFDWGIRKGLHTFIELSKKLGDRYRVVLVGTDQDVEKQLPDSILPIRKTQNQKELAKIYTAADVFVNPTREDTFPTVNIEALACGTPVITFRVGGSPEIPDKTCGSTVECDDIEKMKSEIIRVCEEHPYSPHACAERARVFDKNIKFREYIGLYQKVVQKHDGTSAN